MLLDKRVEILRLIKETGPPPAWRWSGAKRSWAAPAVQQRKNLIAKTGNGAKTVVFTLSKQPFGMDRAILYQGTYHLPTDVDQSSPAVTVVTTAQVPVCTCRALRSAGRRDNLGRPTDEQAEVARFPAAVVEKWTGYAQETPQQVNDTTLVLLTPKEVLLRPKDVVEIEGMDRPCVIRICHLLDEYRNEYEVSLRLEG